MGSNAFRPGMWSVEAVDEWKTLNKLLRECREALKFERPEIGVVEFPYLRCRVA